MIGERLRRLRRARGLTQRALAAPRYSHAYVSTIEAGRRQPSREAIDFFADRLAVSVEELTTGRRAASAPELQLLLQESRVALSEGRLTEAEAGFRRVASRARAAGLVRIHAGAEEGRGLLLERQGEPELALRQYERAETLLAADLAAARADAVAGKARCLEALGDVRYAIHVLESLLDAIEREGAQDPDALVRLHASLLDAYLDAGLYARAAESAGELERLAPTMADPLRVSQMHMYMARLHLVEGRFDDALRSLQRAEDAYRQLHLQTELGYAHLARGYVFSREGRLGEAREQLLRALEVFEATGDRKDTTRALNELARVERLEGRTELAQAHLERSIALMGESDTPILAWSHRELGLVLAERASTDAEKHLRHAIELYERVDQTVDLAVSYRALGDLLTARGMADAGAECYRTGILALEPRL
jgi:tetratricopeptide (TPR) repeat protein